MKAIFLAAAVFFLSNSAIGQTFENPKTLGKNEPLEFMVWYESGKDHVKMILGERSDIDEYLNEVLDFYGISDKDVIGKSRTWKQITDHNTQIELTAILGDRSGTILVKEK